MILKHLKSIFDFYINSSLHVSLATASLVLMTYYFNRMQINYNVVLFVFCGTLLSYNTIKYGSYILKNTILKKSLKLIIVLSLLSFIFCTFLFFKLSTTAQLAILFFAFLSVLYLIPFGKKQRNLRNFAGIKIYIVSFCWAGVTTLIPLFNADISIENDIIFKFLQRFVLTLILILIFEINDLKYDDVRLKTVPQAIGVKNTKKIVYFLLICFFVLEFFKANQYQNQWIVNLILISIIFMFTFFANARRSKYYTLFWVESIPMIWYLLVLIF